MKPQVETSLGLGYRVPLGPGDGGVDVAAVVAVCEALSTRLAQREPSIFIPPVSLLITINTLVTPRGGQDAAGLKAEGLPGRARGVGRAPRPPHRCPSSLGRAKQSQPAALPCPTQGPRHTGLLGKTLDFKQATAPVFARHRFPSFLPTFSLAEREVFQALAYEGRGLRKASWNLRRLPSPGKPSWGAGLPCLCSAARPT